MVNDKILSIGDFDIYDDTTFWFINMNSTFWEQLQSHFNKTQDNDDRCCISSFNKEKIKKNDIILIYQKHKTPNKNAFVCIASVFSDMIFNDKKIKIFNDMNLNKNYCQLDKIYILNN